MRGARRSEPVSRSIACGRGLLGMGDGLVQVAPLLKRCEEHFADLIAAKPGEAEVGALRAA